MGGGLLKRRCPIELHNPGLGLPRLKSKSQVHPSWKKCTLHTLGGWGGGGVLTIWTTEWEPPYLVCLSVSIFPLPSPSLFVKSWLSYRGSLVLYGGPLLLSSGWRFCPSCPLSLFSSRHKGPRFSGLALSLILFLSLSSLLKRPLSPFLFHFSFTTIWSSLSLSSATNL